MLTNGKYKGLLESAEKEKTAVGKSKWIIEILRLMISNDLHHMGKKQTEIQVDMKKSNKENNKQHNRIFILLTAVLVLLLATEPKVASIFGKLLGLIF